MITRILYKLLHDTIHTMQNYSSIKRTSYKTNINKTLLYKLYYCKTHIVQNYNMINTHYTKVVNDEIRYKELVYEKTHMKRNYYHHSPIRFRATKLSPILLFGIVTKIQITFYRNAQNLH